LPWCDECSKFWNPPQAPEGKCPSCGRLIAGPRKRAVAAPVLPSGQTGPAPEDPGPGTAPAGPSRPAGKVKGAPWHFKLLVVGVTVYMVYRIYWLAEWLPKHI
jgi:hypothetical protein